jgi:multicomponent Na+:H+ antiporter subunit E
MTDYAKAKSRWKRLRSVHPAGPLLLLALWMVISGKLTVFLLGVGVFLVVVLVWQSLAMEPLEPAGRPQIRFLRAATYAPWLFWQMILSAFQVAGVILRPSRNLDPQLVEFRCAQPSLQAGVLLAGSITLTPGTVTVDLADNRYVVHALTRRGADELLAGDMARRVARLCTDDPLPPIEVIRGPEGKAQEP